VWGNNREKRKEEKMVDRGMKEEALSINCNRREKYR